MNETPMCQSDECQMGGGAHHLTECCPGGEHLGLPPLLDWQRARYGDDEAVRAALAFYRARGWHVDPNEAPLDLRICDFVAGYRAALEATK